MASWMPSEEIEEIARKYALQNAVLHGGRANPKAVTGKMIAERPELRAMAKEMIPLLEQVVNEINSFSLEKQRSLLERIDPSLMEREKRKRESTVQDLPGAEMGEVVMRFAPGPSGPLHIGHSRVAILNDEYVRKYRGTFINRIEDTNPEKIDPQAYDMIPEDLEWLEVEVHKTIIQSDRFDLYHEITRQLVEIGKAYVCFCDVEEWRSLKESSKACPHRETSIEENLEALDRMLNGEYSEGEAVVVVKTDLHHPNPAIRDFIALRVVEAPHPRTGDRYSAYPMMNLSVAVDDHFLGLTHVLRGKDHLNNTLRQEYLFKYLGWERPWYHHYGFVSIPETVLKTSAVREGITKGHYTGWDDVRLATFRTLERRGIQPRAIRAYWVDVGMKDVDIQFSWENLYAFNKEIVDPEANRYFFVGGDIQRIEIIGATRLESKAPLHPDYAERGYRRHILTGDPIALLLNKADVEELIERGRVRLKDLCNIELIKEAPQVNARFIGNDLSLVKEGVKIVHWVPAEETQNRPAEVITDKGVINGYSEILPLEEEGKMVQFERFGFCRIERVHPSIVAIFAHR
jgi:glutamyl-tRNA synthetase